MTKYNSLFLAALAAATLFHGGCGGCGDDGSGDPDAGTDPDADVPTGDPTTGAWRAGFELPGVSGFGSRVEAIVRAADGTIYLAGIFEDAAGKPARNVVAWDGADYQALGDGLDGWVRGLAIDDGGTLWAAVTTESEQGFGGALHAWDGAAWSSAGEPLDGPIHDLAIVDGDPVVAGELTGSVLRFDGAAWQAFGSGEIEGVATAVAAGPDGPCVAGQFESIGGVTAENAACWNGAAWEPLGAGLPGGVAVLARSPAGQWYAGGTLTFLIDPNFGTYEAGIAVLDAGTWSALDGGIDNGFINEVRAIGFDGDDVLIGGHFETAGHDDVPATHLARWSPTGGWSQLGPGLGNDVGVFLQYLIGGHALLVAPDRSVWIGGLFTRAGATPAVNLTQLSSEGAASTVIGPRTVLGVGGFLDAVTARPDGTLIAGGRFEFAGQTAARNLAVFDGDSWAGLGGGLPGIVRDVVVRRDGSVAVAGELEVDGAPAAFAIWQDGDWQLTGGRVDGVGFALLEDDDGALWLGGDLYTANGDPVDHLVKLAGTAWSAPAAFDGRVGGLAAWDGRVVAVGSFTSVDGAPAAGLAIEEDGGGWAELGGGLDGDFVYASAVAVSPELGVVVGGAFEGVGGNAFSDLAAWDGAAWSSLDGGVDGLGGFGFVSALLAYGDGVFVTGGFDTAGDVSARNLAWFDGAGWHALGAGLNDLAEAMVVVADVLYVGGPFTVAGGQSSSGLAVWDFSGD